MKLLIVAALMFPLQFLIVMTFPQVVALLWLRKKYPQRQIFTHNEFYKAASVGFYIILGIELLILGILYLIFGE